MDQIRIAPKTNTGDTRFAQGRFQVSNDGNTWIDIPEFVLGNLVHESWNALIPQSGSFIDKPRFRYYRFYQGGAQTSLNNRCNLAEIEFYGILLSQQTDSDLNTITCDVSIDGSGISFSNIVEYKASLTPKIVSINPEYGTAVGNTLITLTGDNFGT